MADGESGAIDSRFRVLEDEPPTFAPDRSPASSFGIDLWATSIALPSRLAVVS